MSSNENADPAQIGMRIRGANGQTADLFVVETYGGTDKFKVDRDGNITAIGDFAFTGDLTLTGGLSATTLAVNSAATLPSITGPTTLTGNLTQTGSQAITGEVQITGDTPATITTKITGAPGQTADLLVVEQNNGTDVFRVDKDGVPIWNSYREPADYIVYLDGATYKAKDCKTNEIIHSNASYTALYTALEATIGTAHNAVIDTCDADSGGTQMFHYRDSVVYAPEWLVHNQIDWKSSRVLSLFDEGLNTAYKWQGNVEYCSDDTTNYRWGTKGIRVDCAEAYPTGYSIYFDCSDVRLDLSGDGVMIIRMCAPDVSNIRLVDIDVMSPAWYENFDSCSVSPPTNFVGDWVEIHIPKERFVFKTGTCDWSQIERIRVTVYLWTPGRVTYNFLAWHLGELARPTIVLGVDDDAGTVTDNMAAAMDRHSMRGYVMWAAGNQQFTNNLARLKVLAEKGWDIGFHGYEHSRTWSNLSENALTREVVKWLKTMASHGLLGKWRIAAPPGGGLKWDNTKVLQRYFHLSRLAEPWVNRFPFPSHSITWGSDWTGMSVAACKALIDVVANTTNLQVVYFHGTHNWSVAEWDDFLTYLETKEFDVVTYSDLFSRYMTRRQRSSGTATIASGTSTVTVTHHMKRTPARVKIFPEHAETATWWITNITATQFAINVSGNTSANRAVKWEAEP